MYNNDFNYILGKELINKDLRKILSFIKKGKPLWFPTAIDFDYLNYSLLNLVNCKCCFMFSL